MKRLLLLGILLIVFGVPAVFACEDCYIKGMKDPAGNPVDHARCWASPEGGVEGCIPNGDNCTMWSYGDSCPEQSGGSDGGGSTGSGGSNECQRTPTGMCPSSCFSCEGAGGGRPLI